VHRLASRYTLLIIHTAPNHKLGNVSKRFMYLGFRYDVDMYRQHVYNLDLSGGLTKGS